MAFCPNCGVNNYEGAANCANCGTPLQNTMGYYPPAKKKTGAALIAGIVIAVVAIIAVIFMFGSSPEDPIKNYVKAFNTGKVEYLKKAMPKALYEESDSEDFSALEDMIENQKEYMEDEFGEGKYKYKVLDKEKLDRDELEEYEEFVEMMYEAADINDKPKVTSGYEMEVKLWYDGSKGEDSDIDSVIVLKIDGQWCLYGI